MKGLIFFALLFSTLSFSGEQREKEVLNVLCHPKGADWSKVIGVGFLKAFPSKKISELFTQFESENGACTSIVKEKGSKNKFTYHTKKTKRPMTLTLDAKGFVAGLWFGNVSQNNDSWDSLKKELRKVPGRTNLYVIKNGKEVLFSKNPDKSLALGSTFKVYILKVLSDEVKAGKRSWSDVVKLKEEWKSVPSGVLQKWPSGAPLTLQTLATKMISISDNTATDHLLYTLGRNKVEKISPQNVPFLSTLEMFKLKGIPGMDKKYLALGLKGKRKVLEEIKSFKKSDLVLDSSPDHIDTIEWFANPRELCELFYELKNSKVLAVNPGVLDKANYKYVGYKGGSEPGVIQMTHLVQTKGGDWICVSGTWNDVLKPVDSSRWSKIISRSIDIANP